MNAATGGRDAAAPPAAHELAHGVLRRLGTTRMAAWHLGCLLAILAWPFPEHGTAAGAPLRSCFLDPRVRPWATPPGLRGTCPKKLGASSPQLPRCILSAAGPAITVITLHLGDLMYNVPVRKCWRKGFPGNQVFKHRTLWVLKATSHLISPLKISSGLLRRRSSQQNGGWHFGLKPA